jgi:O-antigen/teichoic acid export membrane protein
LPPADGGSRSPARRLWLLIAHTSTAGLYGVVISGLTLAITARYLGPAGRGIYAAATAWASLFAVLGSLSLGQVVVHHVAGRPREEWLRDVVGTVLALIVGVTLVSWAAVAVLQRTAGDAVFSNLGPAVLGVAFLALPFLIAGDTGRYLLGAVGALQVANWTQMLGATAGLLVVVATVLWLGGGVASVLAGTVLSACIWAVGGFSHLLRLAGGARVRPVLAGRFLRGSAQLHLNAVGNYLVTQASVLVLNHYRAPAETGLYQLAVQLFQLSLIVPSSISAVAFALVSQKGPDGAWPEQRRLLVQAVLLVTGIAGVGYLLAPWGIALVAGREFLPAVPLFRFILPALIGATLSTVMASQWIGRGLFWQAALLTLGVGLAGLASDFVLIPRLGMYGALWSTLLTYGLSVVCNVAMAVWVQRRWRASLARIPGPA